MNYQIDAVHEQLFSDNQPLLTFLNNSVDCEALT